MEQIGDAPPKQVMIWDASKLDDLDFVDEVTDSMGAFAHANKWSIGNLKEIIRQQQDKIKSFEDDLQQQKSLAEAEYKKQINVLLQQHQVQFKILKVISNKKESSYRKHLQNKLQKRTDKSISYPHKSNICRVNNWHGNL
jgi:hypothetical protein